MNLRTSQETEDFKLNIIGLMCIPPFVEDTKIYLKKC